MNLQDARTDAIFDDFTRNDEEALEPYWSQVCTSCAKKHGLGLNNDGSGICGVKGCNNDSDHYYDFFPENVMLTRRLFVSSCNEDNPPRFFDLSMTKEQVEGALEISRLTITRPGIKSISSNLLSGEWLTCKGDPDNAEEGDIFPWGGSMGDVSLVIGKDWIGVEGHCKHGEDVFYSDSINIKDVEVALFIQECKENFNDSWYFGSSDSTVGVESDYSVWFNKNGFERKFKNAEDAAKFLILGEDVACLESECLGTREDHAYNQDSDTYNGQALNPDHDGTECWTSYSPNGAMKKLKVGVC